MGKTRLAIAAAAAAGPDFADGACFVALAELDSAHQGAPALADALGIVLRSGGVDALQQVVEVLRRRHLLLVLDNLEHLLQDGLAGMINHILASAPTVKILATSRARLNLQSEQVYQLGGMTTPSPDEMRAWQTPAAAANYSALALFVQRARRLQPDFELATADLATVAEICRRLGGMPLGIELAAGWMAVLSPADILTEIEHGLDFLATNQADVPARQRSLRTVLDASLAHLLPDEQAVFSRLGLFAGSFSRQAAEQIAGAAPKILLGLVNKSVLRRDVADRFAMHPVVAHFAAENLARDPALRTEVEQRFITHYLACLTRHGQDLSGPKQAQALAALEIDIAHIRQAWRLAVAAGRWEEASAALAPLFSAHHARLAFDASFSDLMQEALNLLAGQGRSRAVDLLSAQTMTMLASHLSIRNWAFLSKSELPAAALALVREQTLQDEMGVALSWLGHAIAVQGDLVQGLEVIGDAEAVLRRRGQQAALSLTLLLKSGLLHGLNQRAEAKAAVEESIAISRQMGDNLQLAHSLSGMGDILASEQEFDAASQLYHESQSIFASLGDLADVANVLYRLADSQMHSGRYEAAIAAFEACRQLFARLGDRFYCISVLSWESLCAARAGDMTRAWELRRMCLQEAQETGEELNIGWSIWEMGELHRLGGEWEAARRCYEEGAALLRRSNFMRADIFIERGWGDLTLGQGQPEQAAPHFQRSLDLAAAGSYPWGMARAHIGLGQTALALNKTAAAWEHFQSSLRLALEWGLDQGLICTAVAGLAATHLAQADADKALALATFALGQPATMAETRRDLSPVIEAASASLPFARRAAAEQRGRTLTLSMVVAAYSASTPL
jgi:predicted ATPase